MTTNLLGLSAEALPAAAAAVGVELSAPEARRVMAHLVSGGAADLNDMVRPIRKDKRAALAAHFTWARPAVVERIPDPADGSVRYLFALDESVSKTSVHDPAVLAWQRGNNNNTTTKRYRYRIARAGKRWFHALVRC